MRNILPETSNCKPNPNGFLWAKFDNENIGKNTKNSCNVKHKDKGLVPIKPISHDIQINSCKETKILRTQFPIHPAAAKTVHRSQGDTVECVITDFTCTTSRPGLH